MFFGIARVTETLTNDNGLALYTPVEVGQMLPDAPRLSESYIVNYEHTVQGNLRVYGQANDHYVGAEHPYLADPTTFGRGHSLGARIGFKDTVALGQESLGHESYGHATADLRICGERRAAAVVLPEDPLGGCVFSRMAFECGLRSRVAHSLQ